MTYERIDGHRLVVRGRIDATVHLPLGAAPEGRAVAELAALCGLPGLLRVACTPDFHKGAGTPVGTVMLAEGMHPGVVGNDIGCGMRLDVLDGPVPEATPDLRRRLRHAYFQGGREVLVPDRARLLAEGLGAPLDGRTADFLPRGTRAHAGGALGGGGVSDAMAPYLGAGSDRCNVLGSIGGGNHFVEIGMVDEVLDPTAAARMGLRRGAATVMVHSGSLDLGQRVGSTFRRLAAPVPGCPDGTGPLGEAASRDYGAAADNCANLAMANRAVLAAMACEALGRGAAMCWDAPHNLAWRAADGWLHRKGATPAAAGEPVLVPGSSGSRSLVAVGLGCDATMGSAPHGAGRAMGRNAARARVAEVPDIVTRIDPRTARADVRREVEARLREEAPGAYKGIETVAAAVTALGMARPVAWVSPVLTVKA